MNMKKTTLTSSVGGGFLLWTALAFAQDCQLNQPATTPDQRFVDHRNGTVSDTQTGLMWKKCLEGQQAIACYGRPSQMSWESAAQQAQLVSAQRFAAQDGWRLPTVNELGSLIEKTCSNPSINLNIFPNTPALSVWTMEQSGANAWSVDFSNGRPFQSLLAGGKYVRLVRDAR
ncbi:MAG: DUF1566 domain-containing protein [Candidatus Thiothrix moscowensis]|nr:DUF1566 domain-containing protein [Candidatus Thiothrix moscowensis]